MGVPASSILRSPTHNSNLTTSKITQRMERKEITVEEDEEQLIMRRLRNSVDELRRGYRALDYRMQRIKGKADQAKEDLEKIELLEEKVCIRGEPVPFRAYIPKEEVIKYRKDQKGGSRLIYKGCKLNNRSLHNFRPTVGHFIQTYDICYATKVV